MIKSRSSFSSRNASISMFPRNIYYYQHWFRLNTEIKRRSWVMEFNNGTHWNISKATWLTSYSNKIYLVDHQRYILIALDVTLMILNLLANSAVLIVLFASKFYQNTSYILLFYLSMSDWFSALVAQPLYLILIARCFNQTYCKVDSC